LLSLPLSPLSPFQSQVTSSLHFVFSTNNYRSSLAGVCPLAPLELKPFFPLVFFNFLPPSPPLFFSPSEVLGCLIEDSDRLVPPLVLPPPPFSYFLNCFFWTGTPTSPFGSDLVPTPPVGVPSYRQFGPQGFSDCCTCPPFFLSSLCNILFFLSSLLLFPCCHPFFPPSPPVSPELDTFPVGRPRLTRPSASPPPPPTFLPTKLPFPLYFPFQLCPFFLSDPLAIRHLQLPLPYFNPPRHCHLLEAPPPLETSFLQSILLTASVRFLRLSFAPLCLYTFPHTPPYTHHWRRTQLVNLHTPNSTLPYIVSRRPIECS